MVKMVNLRRKRSYSVRKRIRDTFLILLFPQNSEGEKNLRKKSEF